MMSDILALDIETANFSHEIGGFGNTAMFEITVAATYDGINKTIYCNEEIEVDNDIVVKELHPKTLGQDLEDFVSKGGKVIGHNLTGFDLPILRDSLDCWAAGEILKNKTYFDNANGLQKALGHRIALGELVRYNLSASKLLNSEDAPFLWKSGRHTEVAAYCLNDSELTFNLYNHILNEGVVKSRSLETGDIIEVNITW